MTSPLEPIERVLRAEAPHVVGALTRRFGRFDAAEDAAQEALLAASTQWRDDGIPAEPRSWLIRVGYRRMVDAIRSEQAERRREHEYTLADPRLIGETASLDADDSLHLLLLCCHPVLSTASQVALTLRAAGGLTTAEIARAYGVTEQTMAVRISRAKRQLKATGARFEFAVSEDLTARIASVMKVLYLVFNEGYTASSGERLTRTDLSAEAIRLARLLHDQTSGEPEPAGLLALLLLTDARRAARTDARGELVPLAEQDRRLWDAGMIAEGSALIGSAWAQSPVGPYRLQAAIAALHDEAPTADRTDWRQIAALYLALEQLEPSGPVMLARVVAVAHAFGDATALELLDRLDRDHGLLEHPLTTQRAHAIRAHLRDRSGSRAEARADFLAAADLTENDVEARYLQGRAHG
ncbi:RNA polymerase sigma factor [Microbacterium hydrocarbonoxydans]|uniref:RNA polymerase sigma factor n=1 Tax=Microbacterium hydrocarbonoxydans TaxID=273678 RepID=UPI0013D9431C|nr:sigma-70 family RNA polymerase sigma factor [Microbacterium hydrocarbonoxydans]